MPYYPMGDYYGRGDYYRGDPGILGSVGKLLGGAAKAALKLAFPLPTAIGTAVATTGKVPTSIAGIAPFFPTFPNQLIPPMMPTLMNPIPPGVITQSPYGTPVSQAALAMQGVGVRGYRPNKTTYVTRGGGTSRWPVGLQVHPKHSVLVKSRRMNVGNARALRRGLRRARGFAKLAARVLVAVRHYKKKGKKR